MQSHIASTADRYPRSAWPSTGAWLQSSPAGRSDWTEQPDEPVHLHVHARMQMALHPGRGRGTIPGVLMSGNRCRHQPDRRSRLTPRRTSRNVAFPLLLNVLLMGFSIIAALLGESALALVAGTGGVGLAREIARRILST